MGIPVVAVEEEEEDVVVVEAAAEAIRHTVVTRVQHP